MIATYIQELLATNNRVIIPNYGAFLVRATSKSKDANTLEEKLKDIYFSPFLKFNDELLEKYIIKKEGVTKEQAAEKIKEFIEKVKTELDDGKPFVIKNFGQFVADKQGKVVFETAAKVTEEKKEAAKPAAKKPAETKKTAAKETKTEDKKTVPPKETKKEEAKPAPAADKKEEPKKPVAEAKKEDKESKLKEYKPEQKTAQKQTNQQSAAKPIYSYKKEKKPVNKGLIWAIAIGLPLAAIFIWGILNFDTVKKVLNKDKAKTEQVAKKTTGKKKAPAKKKAAEVKKETNTTSAKKETETKPVEKKVVTKQPTTPPQKKYYIIAGSFKNEKYAVSYLNKLKAEGYNAEKLSERNGMHAVSFNSFVDKRKALAEYKFLTQEKNLQAWILYY